MTWVLIILLLRDGTFSETKQTVRSEEACWERAHAIQAQTNHSETTVALVWCERK